MTDQSQPPLEPQNGLRQAFTERLLESLAEVAELRAEVRIGMKSLDRKLDRSLAEMHEKLDRLVALDRTVQEHSVAIGRLKTLWSCLVAGIALTVSVLKDWLFGSK